MEKSHMTAEMHVLSETVSESSPHLQVSGANIT
jgi:hypothetical protein